MTDTRFSTILEHTRSKLAFEQIIRSMFRELTPAEIALKPRRTNTPVPTEKDFIRYGELGYEDAHYEEMLMTTAEPFKLFLDRDTGTLKPMDKCKTSFLERLGIITNKTIYKLLKDLMSTIDEVKQDLVEVNALVESVAADVDNLTQQIAALKAQIASGQVATQADIDELAASAQAIKDRLSAVDDETPAI